MNGGLIKQNPNLSSSSVAPNILVHFFFCANLYISLHFSAKAIFLLSPCPFVGDVHKIHHHITKYPETALFPRAFLITPLSCENIHSNPRDKERFTAFHSSVQSLKEHLGCLRELEITKAHYFPVEDLI